jgi:hypothetical protein
MFYRGGTLKFGKLTMVDADLMIVDADQKDPFDFFLDAYNHSSWLGTTRTCRIMVDRAHADYRQTASVRRSGGFARRSHRRRDTAGILRQG